MSEGTRTLIIRSAGILIILIALAAVFLPLAEEVPARRVIGWMLLAAGLVELAAAAALRAHRLTAAVIGAVTAVAGARLLLDSYVDFFEVLNLIILWLVVRAAALGLAAFRSREALGTWIGLSAAVNFLLAIALLAGLPVAMLVVGLFGPTRPISATFAWVIAASLLANAVLLLAAATLQRRRALRRDNSES